MDWFLIAAESNFLLDALGTLWTIAKVALGLGFVIFVHELGHFMAAKACGVKCEKFYVGFDVPLRIGPIQLPRTLGKFQWGETEYGIGIIPLGGYVKMLGQDDNPANAEEEARRAKLPRDEASDADGADAAPGGPESANTAAAKSEVPVEQLEWDPRSYPAKSVPQRMLIISAGVIMNLIFAVLLGGLAYGLGVNYVPTEIAGTSPGDPAWEAGLQPGDKIVQVGKDGEPDDNLRFDWELRQVVAKAGFDRSGDEPVPSMDILVRRGEQETWYEITPTDRLKKVSDFVTLGVRPPRSNVLSDNLPVIAHMAAADATPALKGGDRIVAVNGEPLDPSRANKWGQLPADDIETVLARQISEPVTLTVERAAEKEGESPQTLDVVVPPNPIRDIGLIMEMGPVVAIQKGSPAEGIVQLGDIIREVNGQPVADPMLLPQRLDPSMESLQLTVDREVEGKSQRVELTVPATEAIRYNPSFGRGSRVSLDPIGVVYSVGHQVAAVREGSPADKADMKAGDVLLSATFLADDPEVKKQAIKMLGKNYGQQLEIDQEVNNWPFLYGRLQEMLPGMQLALTYKRGSQAKDGDVETAVVEPVSLDDAYYVVRGLRLAIFEREHKAESVGDALALGFRETKEKLGEVLEFLKLLVTGKIGFKNVGGPIMIATVAGSEASQGISRLLLFLTFLSANLAILNFLPIPALDGGHMVFLIWEGVFGKPVSEKWQGILTMVGVMALLALMVFVFANDIGRLIIG